MDDGGVADGGRDAGDPVGFSITITPVNDVPVAVDDAATTSAGRTIVIAVLANDEDEEGDVLAVDSFAAASEAGGVVADNGDGTLIYTPASGFIGADRFTYTASDGHGGSDGAAVLVTVALNGPPDAVDDTLVAAYEKVTTLPVLANDTDPDGDLLAVTAVTQGGHGTVALNPDGSVTYDPDPLYLGTDTFSYTVGDGISGEDTAVVTLEVVEGVSELGFAQVTMDPSPANRTYPVAFTFALHISGPTNARDAWFDSTLPAGWMFQSVVANHGLCSNSGQDVDCDLRNWPVGKEIKITVVAVPTLLGTYDYTAAIGSRYPENDYTTNTVTTTILVSAFPVAGDDDLAALLDTPLAIDAALDLLANDDHPDDAPMSVESWDAVTAQGGTVAGDAGALVYTPLSGFVGRDSFTYTVCDPDPECDQAVVSISVGEWHLYLGSAGAARVDVLPLEPAAPQAGMLGDYDGDGWPGLTIDKGGTALGEDEKKRQWWDLSLPAGRVMDRAVLEFTFWARSKDGTNDHSGILNVGLYDCAGDGSSCVAVASGTLERDPWGAGTGFVVGTIGLGEVTHTWAPGRVLRVAVTVGNDAGADMEFAFAVSDYASELAQRLH